MFGQVTLTCDMHVWLSDTSPCDTINPVMNAQPSGCHQFISLLSATLSFFTARVLRIQLEFRLATDQSNAGLEQELDNNHDDIVVREVCAFLLRAHAKVHQLSVVHSK